MSTFLADALACDHIALLWLALIVIPTIGAVVTALLPILASRMQRRNQRPRLTAAPREGERT